MMIKYTLDHEEYKNAVIAINSSLPGYQSARLIFILFFSLILFLALPFVFFTRLILTGLFFGLSYYYLFDLLIQGYLKLTVSHENKNIFPKKLSFTIEETSFTYRGELSKHVVPWKSVTRVLETDDLYIFYVLSIRTIYIVKKEATATPDSQRVNQTINHRINTFAIPYTKK